MNQVRVRFAPSPTGYFHVGGARTALFNWIYARQHDGVFVLRIEDTDKERSNEESVGYFLDGLRWLGLDWDEGPVFQAGRSEEHRAAAAALIESGHAYRCFLTPDELKAMKEEAAANKTEGGFRSPHRELTQEDSDRRAADGEPFVVRFRVPDGETVEFVDLVYGKNVKRTGDIEDFVMLRSDGSPLYNLSVVIDDADMEISHVIRGQDHLSNTPKQILLYRALGKPEPVFGHLPLILAPNKAKLSKRKHGEIVSLLYYRDRGFVPQAMNDFLALLGWSPGAEEERLSLQDLVKRFDISKVNKSNAIFNYRGGDERNWTDPRAIAINGDYIKSMPLDDLLPMVKQEMERASLWQDNFNGERDDWYRNVIDLLRERIRTLDEFPLRGRPYFSDDFEMEERAVKKNLKKEGLAGLLPQFADRLEKLKVFDAETVEAEARAFADEREVKPGLVINGSRTALTGTNVGPSMFHVFEVLGRERSVRRLRAAEAIVTG